MEVFPAIYRDAEDIDDEFQYRCLIITGEEEEEAKIENLLIISIDQQPRVVVVFADKAPHKK